MSNKLNETIGGIFITFFLLILLCFLKISISNINSYSSPEDNECKTIDDYIDIKKTISVTENLDMLWNYQIDLRDLIINNGKLIMTCPSKYTKDSQLIIDGNLIASTNTPSSETNYYINDCHDNALYFIDTTLKLKNPTFNDYLILKQIWSSDSAFLYGYVVKQDISEAGFSIIDENKRVLAKIIKNNFKLTWSIDIIDYKHPAASLKLILLLISELSFNSSINNNDSISSNDLCNDTYMILNILFYIYLIISPPFGIYLIVRFFKQQEVVNTDTLNESIATQTVQQSHTSMVSNQNMLP